MNNQDPDRAGLAGGVKALFLFLVGVVVISAYYNSLQGAFHFDDFGNIVDNDRLAISSLSLAEIKHVFSSDQASSGRKVTNLTFALNYYFGQLNPVGFHFVNILIHIINSWLVFYLYQWYLKQSPLQSQVNILIVSALAAMWWATNPIQTNAVTYVVQRMTSLCVLFCICSLIFYIKARSITVKELSARGPSIHSTLFYFAATISWILAMLSKEIAAILPVLIVVHEIYFFDLFSRITKKPFLYGSILVIFVGVLVSQVVYFLGPDFWQHILQDYESRNFTLLERLMTEPRVVFHYIGLFLYPIPTQLRLYYDSFQISHSLLSPATTLAALSGVLVWVSSIFYLFNRNKLLSFSLLWILLCLLLESTVIALELVFEHRFYFPSIGLVLTAITLLIWLLQKTNIRPLFLYIFCIILISTQVLGTITRNRTWANEIDFATDEVQKNPDSVRALVNLSWTLINSGQIASAEPYLQKALLIEPDNIVALNNMVVIRSTVEPINYTVAELYVTRIMKLVQAGKVKKTDNQALLNLSHHLYKNERYTESLLLLEQILSVVEAPEILLHIGQCKLKLHYYKEAQVVLQRAIKLEQNDPEYQYYYALSLKLDKQYELAREVLSEIETKGLSNENLKQQIIELRNSI